MGVELVPPVRNVPVVVGLGDPVMDILANVSAEWLSTVTQEPGGCLPISAEAMEQLIAGASKGNELLRIPGGSAANVMKGIANIAAGGAECRFVGMIARDTTGEDYRRKLAAQGVQPVLLESGSGSPSAIALCLVTPDGQRTMRTCLGASLELTSASQLPAGWADGCTLLHAEGYCLYRPQLAREMMTIARQAGALVSLDLASFELVRNCKGALLGLLQDGLVDLIFANEEEAITLANELALLPSPPSPPNGADRDYHSDHSPEAAVAAAQRYLLSPSGGRCRVAVTSLGSRGCVARGADDAEGASPACRVAVVDTIGAGDFFTAGFLTAYLQGASLQQCCAAGCAAGCEAVQTVGAELPPAAFRRLRTVLETVLATQPVAAVSGSNGTGSGGAAGVVSMLAAALVVNGEDAAHAAPPAAPPAAAAVAVGAAV